MSAASKQISLLARQLFRLSLADDGRVSAERVTAVLAYLEKHPPQHPLAVLKHYHRLVAIQLAKNRALVEHAGPLSEGALRAIEHAFTQHYRHPITAVARPDPGLVAGLRIRVGDDVYESSLAGQLASLTFS